MNAKTITILTSLAAVPFIMVLGNSMLIPVLPEMQKQLGITHFQTSLVISMFSIPAGLTIPFAGFFSDRLGRKKIIAPSLIIYGLGGLIAGIAALYLDKGYWLIITGRIIQGIGAAGTAPVTMALVGDIFISKERSKALGYIEAANGLGKVVSPILGSLVAIIAWFGTFFIFPVLTVPTAIAVWFLVNEPEMSRNKQSIMQYFNSIISLFKNKAAFLITSFITGLLSLLLLFGLLFFLSDYLEASLKLFGVKKGVALAVPVLVMSAVSLAAGSLIKKKVLLMKILIISGLSIITFSFGLLPFFQNPWINIVVMSVAGIGVGLILPCLNTLITSSSSSEQRGMITSLYGGIRFFGVAAGPPLFGILDGFGRYVLFWSGAGAALAVGILCIIALPAKVPEN
ncbi:MFS transporter [Phosphitispora sp. TUW77]|uniref:MFS transporter n=1 Tax=Phosphitispora sp. TUW77 TaxID=3152361 RepID=UPI003AB6968E